jgi:hypothetical protein
MEKKSSFLLFSKGRDDTSKVGEENLFKVT